MRSIALISSLLVVVRGQQVGTQQPENHPKMTWFKCESADNCATQQGEVVIDANWRQVHDTNSSTDCYVGNMWNGMLCPDNQACAENCALEGADYAGAYGAVTNGDSLSLRFVTPGPVSTDIGSRLYLMASETEYQMFKLLGQEFTFDVDVSTLPCGLNGALYFVSMDADGGMSKYPTNKGGAKYGLGYCDAQGPRDLKFINGQANVEGWQPSPNNPNTGLGNHGSCCAEMDIWEANSISTALTPHSCTPTGQSKCTRDDCGGSYSSDRYGGPCDPDGCDFNPYRMGNTDFYGPGKTVDTQSKFTVVTQFIETNGALSEIRRFYVQNGKVIPNSDSTVPGVPGNSINEEYCKGHNIAFGGTGSFANHGGLSSISQALDNGMVLVMSLWDDHNSNMLWLDSTYPTSGGPGAARGNCSTSSGDPNSVESESANASVIFSNIKTGPINSTFTAA